MKDEMTGVSDDVVMEESLSNSGNAADDSATADDGSAHKTTIKNDIEDTTHGLSWPELVAQLLHDRQIANSLSGQGTKGLKSFHLLRLVAEALKEAAKGLPAEKDLMGNLLTEALYLPDPNPEEEEGDFEETLYPPELAEEQKKVVNMVGRLFGPHRLVLMAIEGVAGIKIRVHGTGNVNNPRHVSPGDKFHVTLCARDTPARARLRLECATRDVRRLWRVPSVISGEPDEVRIRQMRLAKILNGEYNPEEDEIDSLIEDAAEAENREFYEAELNLPEATGEEKVTLHANLPLPGGGDDDNNLIARIVGPKGKTLKSLRLRTGCQVELKGKGVDGGSGGAGKQRKGSEKDPGPLHMEIVAIDEPMRATLRLQKCMTEAKILIALPGDADDDGPEEELRAGGEADEKRKEERKKMGRISAFLAKAGAGKTQNAEGILGQAPTATGGGGGGGGGSFASPSPLMAANSFRQPSPHDAGGPIRNAGHGKGHRFNPVGGYGGGGLMGDGGHSMMGGGMGLGGGGGGLGLGGGLGFGAGLGLGGGVGLGDEETVVFVYNLGSEAVEVDLYGLFGRYGAIRKVDIPKHKDGGTRGYGFVTFFNLEAATSAVMALDGHRFEKNAFKPLQVSLKTDSKADNSKNDSRGGGKGGGGSGGENRSSLSSTASPMMSAPSLMGGGGGDSFSLSSSYGMGGGGGGYPMYSSSYSASMDYGLGLQSSSASAGGSFQVFIYNIGNESTELDLYSLCSPYGPVSKVTLGKDHATDKPKGYGFVNFHDYDAACEAIKYLNGHPYPKNNYKKLQVSFKTGQKI